MSELVSVIMPAYNSEQFIQESIDSVLKQTYNNLELLVVDDDSSDGTIDIIKSICKRDYRVKLLNNVHKKGAAGARQTAIDASSGKYLAFLDSDDIWDKKKLEYQIKYMKLEGIAFCYTYYSTFNEKSDCGIRYSNKNINYDDLLSYCDIGNSTVVLDVETLGGCPSIPIMPKEDYALWLTILKLKLVEKAYLYPEVLTKYRLGGASISSNKVKEISRQYRVLKDIGELSTAKALYRLSEYIAHGLKIRIFKKIRSK